MDQLDELRSLLLSQDRADLEQLKQKIEEHLAEPVLDEQKIAEFLPRAIALSSDNGEALGRALADPVSKGLKQSIESEPKYYGDILYPVLAPAIRKAISQAMSSMLATIQRTLESTTTASGISLRIKSLTSGIPYAELALLKSLVFKVEHVYLIERETGVLIERLSDRSASSLDSDAVSAMFSAIESFVNDSFAGEQDDRLTDLKVGERTVWVGHGPKLMLACVIFGEAPSSLKTDLYDTLERIRVAYASELNRALEGQLELSRVDEYLKPILQSEFRESESTKKGSYVMPIALVAVLGLIAYYAYSEFMAKLEYDSVSRALSAQPGMVITQVSKQGGNYVVRGLKDPEVLLPETELDSLGVSLDAIELRTKPFLSLEPEVEIIRFNKQLRPPPGINIVYRDQKVRLLGRGSLAWAEKHSVELLALERDGRLALDGFEVSSQSVLEVLRRDLDEPNLAGVIIRSDVVNGRNVQRISGELSAAQKVTLSRYFSNSVWVYTESLDRSAQSQGVD